MAAHLVNKLLEVRRRAEDRYRHMDALIVEDKKVLHFANFEINTANKIDRRTKQVELRLIFGLSNLKSLTSLLKLQQIFEQKKKEYEDNLMKKKSKLADLYNREMEDWRNEILSRVETAADRKARYQKLYYFWYTS